jgi:hypothetical protein
VSFGRCSRQKLLIERPCHGITLDGPSPTTLPSRALHGHELLEDVGTIVIEDFKLYRTYLLQANLILIKPFSVLSMFLRTIREGILSRFGNPKIRT